MIVLRHLAAAAVLALSTAAATAAPIAGQLSLGGFVQAAGSVGMGSATGLDFVQGANASGSPGQPGGISRFGAGSGTFAGLSCTNAGGGCGAIKDIASFTIAQPVAAFLTLTVGASVISFDLAGFTSIVRDAATNSITVNATGTLHYTGFDATAGTFVLTATGDTVTSFSATTQTGSVGSVFTTPSGNTPGAALTTSIPEPSAYVLLAGALALFSLRRRQSA